MMGNPPSSTIGAASAFNVTPIFTALSTCISEAFRTPHFGSLPAPSGNRKATFGQKIPAFEASSAPAFGSPTFFGSGTATSSFTEKNSPALGSASTPILGSSSSSPFIRKHYNCGAVTSMNDMNTDNNRQVNKLMSIPAMPTLNKSPKELRWEHHQMGNKVGPKYICEKTTGNLGQSFPSSLFFQGGISSTPNPSVSPPSYHTCIAHPIPSSTTVVNTTFALGLTSPKHTGSNPSFNSVFGTSCGTFGSRAPSLGNPLIAQATTFSFGLDRSSPSFASTFGSSSVTCGSYTPSIGLGSSFPLAIGSVAQRQALFDWSGVPFVRAGGGASFASILESSSGKHGSYSSTLAISPASIPSLGSSFSSAIGSVAQIQPLYHFDWTGVPFVGSGSGTSFASKFESSSGKHGSCTATSAISAASTPSSGLGSSSLLAIGSSSNFTSLFGSSSRTYGSFMPPFSSCLASPFGVCSSPFPSSNPFGVNQTEPFVTYTASSRVSSIPAFSTIISTGTASFCKSTKDAGLIQTLNSSNGILKTSLPGQTETSGTSISASVGRWQAVDAALSNSIGLASITGMGQNASTQRPVVSAPVTNPFGSLPAMPSVSIGRGAGIRPPTEFGISSMPISGKNTPTRTISWLTSRHIMQRPMIRMRARRYHSKKESSSKIAFFSDSETTSNTKKVDGLYIPHENPRALFIHQLDSLTPAKETSSAQAVAGWEKQNGSQKNWSNPVLEESGIFSTLLTLKTAEINIHSSKSLLDRNGTNGDDIQREGENKCITGHRAGQAVAAGKRVADVDGLMPKLQQSYYYTEPTVQELAAKEREEPGYCSKVKDFVVGRQGYGSVKFLGETDVQGLDLESIIQFNKCEVLVYMDESEKPVIGAGLNKPAEITLLNVTCIDKRTGQHYIEGPEVEKFEKRLKRKTEEQEAEFISYNAAKGEWKFHVKHFSRYSLDEFVTMNAA